jgi:hypothetical protein
MFGWCCYFLHHHVKFSPYEKYDEQYNVIPLIKVTSTIDPSTRALLVTIILVSLLLPHIIESILKLVSLGLHELQLRM